jgi:predicted PurR-regulated permease PerM
MPRIRPFGHRLVPHSRRTRGILIGDEIFTKVGGHVLANFLTVPRVTGRRVQVPAVVSVVAVLAGGTLMGIVGVLVAIPVAAVLRLPLHEVTFSRLDAS